MHEFKPFDTHTYNVSHATLTLTLTLMVVVVAACHPLAMALLTMSHLRPMAWLYLPTYYDQVSHAIHSLWLFLL